jgi:hypothetical protein
MELLADIFGRKYWMLEEQRPGRHIVFIEDVNKKGYAEICLETGELISESINVRNRLKGDEVLLAKSVIQRFRKKLLEDWDKLQQGKGISKLCIKEQNF